MQQSGNIIAFDYGTRRIGVAVGNPKIGQGRGIGIVDVARGKADFLSIEKFVHQWQPERFVIGIPGDPDQSPSPLTKKIIRFGQQLTEKFDRPVSHVDETLSTEESNYRINQATQRIPKRAKVEQRNLRSAEIILESYFFQMAPNRSIDAKK